MALTTLDPRTALIVIDLQKGIIAYRTVHPLDEVVGRARSLADAFRRHGLPVALVNVAGRAPGRTERPPRNESPVEGWSDLVAELDRQPSDIVVTKRSWGAFAGTDLEAQLRVGGVTQVVVAGVATGTGVEATARQAYEQGFNVTLAIDAMTDMRLETHEHSVAQIFPRLGETGTTREIIELLERRGTT